MVGTPISDADWNQLRWSRNHPTWITFRATKRRDLGEASSPKAGSVAESPGISFEALGVVVVVTDGPTLWAGRTAPPPQGRNGCRCSRRRSRRPCSLRGPRYRSPPGSRPGRPTQRGAVRRGTVGWTIEAPFARCLVPGSVNASTAPFAKLVLVVIALATQRRIATRRSRPAEKPTLRASSSSRVHLFSPMSTGWAVCKRLWRWLGCRRGWARSGPFRRIP